MNKFFYLFVSLVAIGLSSCSKDDVNTVTETGAPSTLKLTILSTSPAVKSNGVIPTGAGDDPATGEGKINRLTVGVFNGNNVDVITETTTFTLGTKSITATIPATAGARTVLVVANAPANHFAGVHTIADFKAKSINLDVTTPDGGVSAQLSNNLPMYGEATTPDGSSSTITVASSTTPTAAKVSLTRLVSRISIDKIENAFDPSGQYSGAVFTPKKVYLYNAKTTSTWDQTTPTTNVLGCGDDDADFSNKYTSLGFTQTKYLGSVISGATFSLPYYFYTFANFETSTPTKLIIEGEFTYNSVTSTVYYPIVINKPQAGTTTDGTTAFTTSDQLKIKQNQRFFLRATIKGKGVTTPNENIDPADISLTVSVLPWALDVTQYVDFY